MASEGAERQVRDEGNRLEGVFPCRGAPMQKRSHRVADRGRGAADNRRGARCAAEVRHCSRS
eukprot:316801-Chlamydomonas_euryale.AAC.2